METATQPGAAPAIAPDTVDQFQGLWDSIAAADAQPKEDKPSVQQPEAAEAAEPAEAPQAAEVAEGEQQQPAEPEGDPKAVKDPEPEAKEYESLDAYLKEQKLEPESFMALPVTVKVDGKEQSLPLSEIVKGYQLSSASYQRMNEAAEQRRALFEEQTKTRQAFAQEQQQVRQALGVRIQQAEALVKSAQEQLLGDFNAITPAQWQQLRAENPGEYAALSTQFQQRQQALQQQLQQIALAKQQEAQAENQTRLQALPVERERLLAARAEWRDPAKAQAAQQAMMARGRALGFSDAELQGVIDHRQLLALDEAARYQPIRDAAAKLGVSDAELINMAGEFAKLKAQTPSTLKRVRTAPKMAAPGTRQVRDPNVARSQSAREAWEKSDFRNEDAAAAYFEHLA